MAVIVFDLNGRLTDPAALGAPWGAGDLGVSVLSAAVQSAMVDTILGDSQPFSEHIEAAWPSIGTRLEELGCEPREVTFVSPHACDLAGAAQAGMRTAFVVRDEGRASIYPRPDIEAADLIALAAALA